jgi:hypothetical protein
MTMFECALVNVKWPSPLAATGAAEAVVAIRAAAAAISIFIMLH